MTDLLPARASPWPAMAAVGASVAIHLGLLATALHPPSVAPASGGRILPALYIYAPDRRPAVPRGIDLSPELPLGVSMGREDRPVAVPLPGGTGRPAPPPGLLPPGPPGVTFDSVFSVLAVDSEVVRQAGSAAPVYPPGRLEEGGEGVVEAEFVVDTTGRVDLASVVILVSTHAEFTRAVREALPGMRFRPAWRHLRKVRQLVRQRFTFRLAPPPEQPVT